jgi:hypothetical protein
VHYCPATAKFHERQYSDFTNLKAFPSNSTYPTTVSPGFLNMATLPDKEVSKGSSPAQRSLYGSQIIGKLHKDIRELSFRTPSIRGNVI